MQAESSGAVRSQSQVSPENQQHRFIQMLKERRLSAKDVADAIGAARPSVLTWYKQPGNVAYRPIPERFARAIRDKYGVPLSAWHRVRG